MKNKIIPFWKPLFAVVVWGFSFIATKNALREINPVVIVFIRQILGISFLALVAVKQKQSFTVNIKDHGWVFVLAIVASLHLWIQITGLQWTSASNTGWIIGITPIFMTMMGFILFKEKILPQQIIGIIISFVGLLLLIGKGNPFNIDIIKNKGDALVVASSVTWAVYSMVNKKIMIHYSPIMTTFYMFLFVAIIISPFAVNQQNIKAVQNLSPDVWMSVLFLGIVCSGIAYALWAHALKEMSAAKVGAFLYVEPFVTFFGAWLLLNEQVTVLTLFCGITIVGGVILVNRN